jgi:hypothetical protein
VHERLPDNRYLFAYGRYRRVYDPDAWDANGPDPLVSATGIALLDELAHGALERRTTTLSRPDGRLLRDLSRYLVAIHEARSSDPGMQTIWERLQRSLPALQQSLERIEMVRGEMAYIPMIIRRGVRLGLHELSDGYQAFLVILFDLILRYAYLFSTLKDSLEGIATKTSSSDLLPLGEAVTAHTNKFLDAGVFSCYPSLAVGTKTCLSCEVTLW